MSIEDCEAVLKAIQKATMDAILPGGVWTIALLGASQIAAVVGIFVFYLAWRG